MEVVTREMLEDVARSVPAPRHEDRRERVSDLAAGRGFDLGRWIEQYNVPVKREGEWGRSGYRYVLEECPWHGHSDASAYVVRFANGALAAGCHHNSCQDLSWRDVREHYEPGCYDRLEPETHTNLGGATLAPMAAKTVLPPVPPFPLEVLPPVLRTLVEEATRSIVCPPEFVAVPMLATLGAAIGNSRVMALKKGWTEGAGLYVAVIADTGAKKTPSQKVATRPAWRAQAERKREYDEAMADYHREKREWETQRRRVPTEGETVSEPPEEPTMHRTVIEDTTVEALFSRLEENSRGVLCAKDELSGWVRALDQYKGGKGSDRQFWLSVWSNSPVAVDRKHRPDPLMIFRPFVGLAGSIQPGILSELKNNREDGLLDRFLFAYPDPVPSRWTDNEISDEATSRYQELYDRLYALHAGKDENGEPSPRRVGLTSRAKEILVAEIDSLREEMERPGFPEYLKGTWSKLEAYIARLSLVLALARIAESGNPLPVPSEAVSEHDVRAAARLVEYFKAHARKAYAKLHGKNPEALLGALERFLRDEGGDWEGQTSVLYELLEARSAPGLPGGQVPFGKWLRKVVSHAPGLIFENGWQGRTATVRLSLVTPGTSGSKRDVVASRKSGAGGTGGRNSREE